MALIGPRTLVPKFQTAGVPGKEAGGGLPARRAEGEEGRDLFLAGGIITQHFPQKQFQPFDRFKHVNLLV